MAGAMGWCRGPGWYVGVRPVYAPALVAFVGGPGFVQSRYGLGGGGVGRHGSHWVPVRCTVPAYHVSDYYVRQVNVTHVTNVTNITTIVNNRNGEADRRDFANRKYAHAVTFVPAEVIDAAPAGRARRRRAMRNDPQVRALVADNASRRRC